MRIDVLGLQAFVSIAERGSFNGAATHLNLSQTALSHRIRKLEDSLATTLFERTTRQVMLTPAGAALLPRATKIFADLGEAISEVRGTSTAAQEPVVLGCLPTIAMQILPRAMQEFKATHHDVMVKVHDSSATEIAARVLSGEAEFGITVATAGRWDLDMVAIAREPFVLVCHRSLPAAAHPVLTWAQLQDMPLVRISAETGNRILIDDALGARRETMRWQYEVQRVTSAVSLVRSGIGAAIVPQLAFDVIEADDIVAIPLRSPAVSRTLVLVTRKGAPLRPSTSALLKLLSAHLKSRFS